jgi:N-acyl-D-amino-acid deacylase
MILATIAYGMSVTAFVAGTQAAVQPPEAVRAAIQRSLPLLQSSADTWLQRRACSSCHHQGLGLLTVAVARERGYTIDEGLVKVQMERTLRPPNNWMEKAVLGEISTNETIGQSLRALGVGAAGGARGLETDAIVHLLAGKQHVSGAWPSGSHRPPHEDTAFTATASTIRTLKLFPPPNRQTEIKERIARARRWLESATPESNEDRVMQLFGLSWSGVSAKALQARANALLKQQRPDGGWSQIETRESDPYATGEALVALNQTARVKPTDPAWQRGLAYLVKSQLPDGSWHVPTRRTASPGLPYFETGYPHGKDQFISYAGAAWATMALMLSDRDAPSPAIVGQPPGRGRAVSGASELVGLSPLMRAAFDGTHGDFDRALAGTAAADIDAQSPLGLTALMFAAHDPYKVKKLLDSGASTAATTKAGHTALLIAAGYDGAGESVDLLLGKGSAVDAAPREGGLPGIGPLGRASLRGDTVVADRLLRAGAHVNGVPTAPVAPVMLAAWIGDADMVTWLAGRGADMNAKEPGGTVTALMMAAEDGQTNAVKALLEHGASVGATDGDGYSALDVAARGPDYGHTKIIELLLAAGADPTRKTPNGETPVSLAERWKKPHQAVLLRPR